MTTHRNTRTNHVAIASKLGVALLSAIALITMTAHASFAADHDASGQIAPQPQPQPPAENDDKQGPVKCAPFDTDLVQWNFEVNDAGTQLMVTISYADDYDTCSSDLAVATWTLPSADVDRTDGDAQVLDIWEPNINDIEKAGSLTVPMMIVGCYNEAAILFGPTTIADEKFVDLCPAKEAPVDQPNNQPNNQPKGNDNANGAGEPGGPELPRTGSTSTALATIAGLVLASGLALSGASRRRGRAA